MTFAELFLVGRLAVSKIIPKQGAGDYTSAPGAGPQGESDGNARLCYSTSFGFIQFYVTTNAGLSLAIHTSLAWQPEAPCVFKAR